MNDKTANTNNPTTEWPDLAIGLYDRLTGRDSAINYELRNMQVEVPRDTSENSPRATWKFNGTIRITTDEPAR